MGSASLTADSYCLFDTAFGACGVAWGPYGLTRLQLPERGRQATETRLRRRATSVQPEEPPSVVGQAISLLKRYFAGESLSFEEVAVDLRAVPDFERRVYAALRAVAWGSTTTYGELARRAGEPQAARDVGVAMGRNPVPIIIPCHRVLAAGNRIGGFSAYGGALTKERLLALEGVHLSAQPAFDFG